MGSSPRYSVVVPVYNTALSLPELEQRLRKVFLEIIKSDYELIFVDDASPNGDTWPTLVRLAADYPQVIAIRLASNRGQQNATLCGMAEASGDFIITMDDDLQHRPEEIPRLIEFENHDLVIAQFSEKKHSYLRTAASSVKSKFDLFLLGVPRSVRLSPFRLIRREVVEKALRLEWPYPFIPALLFNVTTDAVGVGVAHDFRFDGNSGYTGPKLIRVFGRMLFNYLTAGKFGRKMIELLRPFLKSAGEWPPYQIGNIEARRDNSSIYHRDGPVRNNAAG